MSLLVICEILGLLVNTLNANDKYSLRYKKNILQPIAIIFSKKNNFLSKFVAKFLQPEGNFEHFQKKITFIVYVYPKLRTVKNVVR